MATQALYRKWRSQTFEEVVGQEHVSLTLRNALRDGRMSHAYLFTGPRGTGKTSMARILAKAINCLDDDVARRPCNQCRICTAITEGHQLDLIEIDAASNRGIDEIRDLRDRIGYQPNEARYKVYIIDEVHMLTKEAFNALLKTLEEPPPHAVFVLATTEPDRVPETVRSRCQRFDFRRIPTPEIVEHLAAILSQEGRQAAPEALVAIARRSTGSMRDAISLLDQLLSYGDEVLDLERVERVLGLVDIHAIGRLVDAALTPDAAAGLSFINGMVAEGVELGQLVDQVVAYLRGVLFVRVAGGSDLLDVPQDVAATMVQQAGQAEVAFLLGALRAFMEARSDLRDQIPGVPQLPLELAFLRTALPATRQSAAAGTSDAASNAMQGPGTAAAAAHAPVPQRVVGASPAEPARTTDDGPGPRPTITAQLEVAPEPVAAEGSFLDQAQKSWPRFLESAGKRCGMKVQAALRSARPIDVVGQIVVLQFSHAFARDLVSQAENSSQIEALWQELLGRKVGVRCVLRGENVTPASATVPPASAGLEADEDMLLHEARKMGAVVKPLR